MDIGKRFISRMNARGLANCFVNQSLGALNINGCLRGWRFRQLGPQPRARLCVQKIPEQEQVEMGCRSWLGHFELYTVSTTCDSGWVRSSAAPARLRTHPLSQVGLTLSKFENDSILEGATIKARVEQTRDRVGGRFDDRLAHAIERRVEQDRHACLFVKLSHQFVKSAI